jgi:type VI secretion system protein ImpB
MGESIHDKLSRVRKPHVHITYEVFKDGATEIRELPFIVGVLGDFSGNPKKPLEKLNQRDFVEIDRDNFNEVMEKMRPELNFKVDDVLAPTKEGEPTQEFGVTLKFNSMRDFEPGAIVEQVPKLKQLADLREYLQTLAARSDAEPEIEGILDKILTDPEEQSKMRKTLGLEEPEKK